MKKDIEILISDYLKNKGYLVRLVEFNFSEQDSIIDTVASIKIRAMKK